MDKIEQAAFVVEIINVEYFAFENSSPHLFENRRVASLKDIEKRSGSRKQNHEYEGYQKQQQRIDFAIEDVFNMTMLVHGYNTVLKISLISPKKLQLSRYCRLIFTLSGQMTVSL